MVEVEDKGALPERNTDSEYRSTRIVLRIVLNKLAKRRRKKVSKTNFGNFKSWFYLMPVFSLINRIKILEVVVKKNHRIVVIIK